MSSNLILDSLKRLSEQFADGLKQATAFSLPKKYRSTRHIVVSGMGGSNLAGRLVQSLFEHELKVPLLINADYETPAFVGPDTLFIACSYSGSTEETLAAYAEAKKKRAKIVVLTAAGQKNRLAAAGLQDGLPVLAFAPQANPSGQPRLGLGYALVSLLVILKEANFLKISLKEISSAAAKLASFSDKLAPEKSNNQASKLADQLFTKNIMIVAGPFLAGNAHTLRNQFNENSKNLAAYLILPELNHYALEGLRWPKSNQDNLLMLFIESNLYSPRVTKRLALTKKVAQKNKIKTANLTLNGQTRLEQSLNLLALGAWTTYYLAQKNQVDPAAIPWVDWFKKELK